MSHSIMLHQVTSLLIKEKTLQRKDGSDLRVIHIDIESERGDFDVRLFPVDEMKVNWEAKK